MKRENTNNNMMVDEMELNNNITEEELLKRIKELEKMIYRKDMEIEFKEKVIEICSEKLGFDVKKKYYENLANNK